MVDRADVQHTVSMASGEYLSSVVLVCVCLDVSAAISTFPRRELFEVSVMTW